MQQFEFHHPSTNPLFSPSNPSHHREWQDLEPGITQLTLNHDPSTGRGTYLQRWAPNTENQTQNFVHEYVEEIMILEGDLRDLRGRKSGTGELPCEKRGEDGGVRAIGGFQDGETEGEMWTKGCYAYRKPGMEHGPFRSEGGCLMFTVCLPGDERGHEKKESS